MHVSVEGSGKAARIRAASPEALLVADALSAKSHVLVPFIGLTPKIEYVPLRLSPCEFG